MMVVAPAAVALASASAIGDRPLGGGVDLEHADRAVPDDGLGAEQRLRERGDGVGPDVDRLPVGGDRVARDGLDRAHGAALEVELVGDDEVGPQHQLVARLGQQAARQLELVVLDDRLADLQPLRLQEGVGHAAADQQLVDARQAGS